MHQLRPLAALLALWGSQALAAPQLNLSEPALSPDGKEIAFVAGGDIWTVAASGGEARLLVAHPATESRPQWSPDGKTIAFVSHRSGNGDLYTVNVSSGALSRLTWDDRAEQMGGWSADGKWLYFASPARNIQRMNDVYRVAASGGQAQRIASEPYVDLSYPVPSPDGKTVAVAARGFDQWWRKGSAHIDQNELWLIKDGQFRQLSPSGARYLWPMWHRSGEAVLSVSDRNGAENLWQHPLQGEPRQLTSFKDGRVLWPNMAANGSAVVFERDFGIWRYDLAADKAEPVAISLKGAVSATTSERLSVGHQQEELALSPDGKQIAFIARGEVWLVARDGGEARRLTRTSAAESQLAWSPDSKRLVYVSERSGAAQLWRYDLASGSESRLTQSADNDATPRFSPDGKTIAYARAGREVRLVDVEGKQDRLLATAKLGHPPIWSDHPFAWSPDGEYLAFIAAGDRLNRNVYLVPSAGGPARPVSRLANPAMGKRVWFHPEELGVGNRALSWSSDGSHLLFRAFQHSDMGQVVRIDLVPSKPVFKEDADTPRASIGPALVPQYDWALRRATPLPLGLDVQFHATSPDGKSLAVIATAGGQQNVWLYPLDPSQPAVARQLTATAGAKQFLQWTPDSNGLVFLEGGKPQSVALDGKAKPLAIMAELDVDFDQEKAELFDQAWRLLRDNFYDPAMHGLDWNAVHARFRPHAEGARSRDELRRVISLMLGELGASHLGIASRDPVVTSTGRLGIDLDDTLLQKEGKFRLASVLGNGPAVQAGLKSGEFLLAVDGETLSSARNLDALLDRKIGRKVLLRVQGSDGKAREVAIKPIGYVDEAALRYRDWVEANRSYVDKQSGGKLGYVHLINMVDSAWSQFLLDLDADNQSKEGVVIDVRNNFGGYVDSYVLDVLNRRSHFRVTPRGLTEAPGRISIGTPALEKPTVAITNKITLSDGEVFTEGYRAARLGPVIGEPGAGWVIFTSFKLLVDGSYLRLPFGRTIASEDGLPLENRPRKVDVEVEQPLGQPQTDKQLDAAIAELIRRVRR